MNFLFVAAVALSASIAYADSINEISIGGKAQVFSQSCQKQEGDRTPACTPPQPLAAPVDYALALTRPTAGIAFDRWFYRAEELSVVVEAYWRAGEGQEQHYVVVQTTVLRGGNVLARCSRYEADDKPKLTIVGACQGAETGAEQNGKLFGVSLQK
jgi:hypothetical protein